MKFLKTLLILLFSGCCIVNAQSAGGLLVSSEPDGATVKFNNSDKNKTPFRIILKPGEYTVTAEKRIDAFQRWYYRGKVTVREGNIDDFFIRLTKEYVPGHEKSGENEGSFTDKRDGHKYKTVKIGTQIWMAENLAYKTSEGSWAYNNDENLVKTYGRLYNWETAKNVCPDGWHLPTEKEWNELTNFLGGNETAGNKLKAKSNLWLSEDLARIDPCGFNALPAGCRYDFSGAFYDLGYYAYFWTDTPANEKNACRRYVYSNYDNVNCFYYLKTSAYSVRCVKD